MIEILHYIDGALVPSESALTIDNLDPSTGLVYSKIARGSATEVGQAVKAAQKAFPEWSQKSAIERSAILHRIADLIAEQSQSLAAAESQDNGKPVSLARKIDIPRAEQNFRFFANIIVAFESEAHSMPDAINYTTRKPLGAVGCISPWNLPLYLFSWKIAPALAAGNTVVAKPSEITPYTAFLLSKICQEAGLPKGVLNIVHGFGHETGQAIVEHPDIKAISFTGGTQTGKKIAATAAPMFKKLSLELGGKNPNIIFEDADLEEAISTSIRSSFANQGEICLCGSRILIHQSIYEAFKEAFIQKVDALKVGDPKEDSNFMGAIVSEDHYHKILSYIQLAKEEGGVILSGGNSLKPEGRCANGFFIRPTVIEGLDQQCRTNTEEIFGPVVTLQPFSNEEEAIRKANAVQYGLSASIWTQNLQRAHRVADQLEAGVIWVNTWLHRDLRTPFGGTKSSGVGREGGKEALRFFTEAKNICIKY